LVVSVSKKHVDRQREVAWITIATQAVPFDPSHSADLSTHIRRLMADPNGYYFNAHTTLNGNGAVRGPFVIQ
jgi:hypothetical protein